MGKSDLADLYLEYWMLKRNLQEVLKCLRERKEPLSAKECRQVADFFDPEKPQPTGRPKLSTNELAYATKTWPWNITELDFIHVDAYYRSFIGYPKFGILDAWDARDKTCETLGIKYRTYDRIYTRCKGHSLYSAEKLERNSKTAEKKYLVYFTPNCKIKKRIFVLSPDAPACKKLFSLLRSNQA
jgi:hypothetical protein